MLNRSHVLAVLTKRRLPLLLCVNLLLLMLYLSITYQLTFHSDSAIKNLLAQEIAETGQYFPRDWNYANGDLWIVYTQTWIIPLLHFFPNGFALHVVSDLVTAALTLSAVWLVGGLLGQSRTARLLALLVISSGMSEFMAEHIFGQGAYGSMFYQAGFLLYAYWALYQAEGRARWLWGSAVALLVLLAFWSNPQRGLIFYGLPLTLAALTLHWLDRRTAIENGQPPPRRHPRQLALCLLCLLAGAGLHTWTLHHVNNYPGEPLLWLSPGQIGSNLLDTVRGVVALFDGWPRANTPVLSLAGLYQAPRLVAALALLLLLPWAVFKALRTRQRSRLYVAVFTATSIVLNAFIAATTSLADMSTPEASVRYLVPSLMLMLIILAGIVVDRRALSRPLRVLGAAALLVLATSAPTTYAGLLQRTWSLPWQGPRIITRDMRMMRFLDSQGLRYGYAGFWNAGKISVLSDQRIRIRPILIEQGVPVPMRKLSSNRWYNPAAWTGPTFMVLSDDELHALNLERLGALVGAPRRLDFEEWHVLVFNRNLAAALPDWDMALRTPAHYPAGPDTPAVVGKLDGAARVAEAGTAGMLQYGPYRSLGAGRYRVTYSVETSGVGVTDFGFVDVTSNNGSHTEGTLAITQAGAQQLTVEFSAPETLNQVEFHAFSNGRGRFMMRGADIVRLAQP